MSLFRICFLFSLMAAVAVSAQTVPEKKPLLESQVEEEKPSLSRNPITETGSEADHLLGDFGGLRTRGVNRGIHISAGYIAESLGTISGGARRGNAFGGLGQFQMDLDLEKLAGWRRGYFRASSLWVHGSSASGRNVGNELTVSNIDAYDSIRLYELWFEQGLCNDRLWLRAGNLLADTEFATSEYGGLFLNAGFGWPAFISANTLNTGPAFNVAALGFRVWYDVNENWHFAAGVYDGDTFDSAAGDSRASANGLRFHLDDDQGVFAIGEVVYHPNRSAKATGLPGAYRVGAWQHNKNQIGQAGTATPNQTYGLYFGAEQLVWREPGQKEGENQGLGLFLRGGVSPAARAAFEYVFDGGFNYTGLIPSRDDDQFGVGVVYAKHSKHLDTDYEMVVESSYKIQLKPWWNVQPNVQWIRHPSGTSSTPDAWVVGLRTTVTF